MIPYPWGMNIIEYAISLLAPHVCLGCRREGNPVCLECLKADATVPLPTCYRCKTPLEAGYICSHCSQETGLEEVLISASYAGLAKDLLSLLKFQRAKAASLVIAAWLDIQFPALPPNTIICPVPTVPRRARRRGYDQAKLIAKGFSKHRGLHYSEPLIRLKPSRQVGAGREERFANLREAFMVSKDIKGSKILLFDDVLTTGATVEAAAQSLLVSGAGQVGAAVFAH